MNAIIISLVLISVVFSSCDNGKEKGESNWENKFTKTDTSEKNISHKESYKDSIEHYDYDTLLKGKYTLLFEVDDSTENIYLKKDRIIKKVASCSKGLPYKNLGYEAADFADYFVLAHSFGSGNPQYIELIEKKSGESVLENAATWVGADENRGVLIYCLSDDSVKKDEIILYDIKNKRKEYFNFPKNSLNESGLANDIHIDTVTDRYLTITYSTGRELKSKTYERR